MDSVTTPVDSPVLSWPADGLPAPVDTPAALDAACAALAAGSGPVALDTERAQSFRYSARAYLIQLRRAGAGTILIDPVAFQDGRTLADLSRVARALDDAEWILHAATQDLPCLAEIGLRPSRLFDTELAGRLLGYPHVALGTMLEHFFGVRLLKEQSAADWSKRPLPEEMLAYAALDVELLIPLRDALAAELDAAGKRDWAAQEFEWLARSFPVGPAIDEDRWRHTHGLHGVATRRGLAVVRGLWTARDAIAREADQAPGRVLIDAAIVEAAATAERLPAGRVMKLGAIDGFHRRVARTYRAEWQAAIDEALRLPATGLPPLRTSQGGIPAPQAWQRVRPAAWERWQAVRPATLRLAEGCGVPVENLVSPAILRQLVWEPPARLDESAVAEHLAQAGARPWQVERLAPLIAPMLAGAEPATGG